MTIAHLLKSRMTRKCHVRFGSGGGVGDRPADHNWAAYTENKEVQAFLADIFLNGEILFRQ